MGKGKRLKMQKLNEQRDLRAQISTWQELLMLKMQVSLVGSIKKRLEPGEIVDYGVHTVFPDNTRSISMQDLEDDFDVVFTEMKIQNEGIMVSFVHKSGMLPTSQTIGLDLRVIQAQKSIDEFVNLLAYKLITGLFAKLSDQGGYQVDQHRLRIMLDQKTQQLAGHPSLDG